MPSCLASYNHGAWPDVTRPQERSVSGPLRVIMTLHALSVSDTPGMTGVTFMQGSVNRPPLTSLHMVAAVQSQRAVTWRIFVSPPVVIRRDKRMGTSHSERQRAATSWDAARGDTVHSTCRVHPSLCVNCCGALQRFHHADGHADGDAAVSSSGRCCGHSASHGHLRRCGHDGHLRRCGRFHHADGDAAVSSSGRCCGHSASHGHLRRCGHDGHLRRCGRADSSAAVHARCCCGRPDGSCRRRSNGNAAVHTRCCRRRSNGSAGCDARRCGHADGRRDDDGSAAVHTRCCRRRSNGSAGCDARRCGHTDGRRAADGSAAVHTRCCRRRSDGGRANGDAAFGSSGCCCGSSDSHGRGSRNEACGSGERCCRGGGR